MTPMVPKTSGKIFQLSKHAFLSGTQPRDTNELAADDDFTSFWLDFKSKIIVPTQCEALLEAYVAVYSGTKSWADGLSFVERATRVQGVVDIIRNHPPDIIILDQLEETVYGFHTRQPDQWPYVIISNYWVDQWRLAIAFNKNRRLALSLETVLRATLVHELAHWFSSLRVGPYTEKFIDASNRNDFSSLSPQEDAEQKAIPELLQADLTTNNSEAGYFVELNAGGGIVVFDISRDDVFFCTTTDEFWSPSTTFLLSLRQKGYALFVPGLQDIVMSRPTVTNRIPYLASLPSTQLATSPSRLLNPNYHDSITFIGNIYKHGSYRILPPSQAVINRRSELQLSNC